ncbi:MAG: hypothetical protein LBE11_03690 [Prevotellaceae bacterium]|jgi:predicted nucleotidyltransferase|nr:hypothetical protein [Prevotellaceae bacterium]
MSVMQEIIKSIQTALRKIVPDATAILYGSEARGDARLEIGLIFVAILQVALHK